MAKRAAHLLFGEALKHWRQERGFSQERLGELVGLTASFIGMLERAEKNTTLDTLEKLSDALSIELRDFFMVSEDDPPTHRRALRAASEILRRGNEADIEFLVGFCELLARRIEANSEEQ